MSNEQQRQLVATPEEAVANLKARLSDHPEPTPESMTDELAAIEARHANCFKRSCDARDLLAALHAEQEARARVEALTAEDWSAITGCLSACANDPTEPERYRDWYAEVLAKVRAALAPEPPVAGTFHRTDENGIADSPLSYWPLPAAPDASEGEPTDG